MAKYDGKLEEFDFGAFTIPTGYITSVDWPLVRDMIEATGAGQLDKEKFPMERSSTITINGWDDAAGTIRAAFRNDTAEAEAVWYPQGNVSTKPTITADAFVTNFNAPATHNQIVPFTITLEVNGAVADGTVT